MLLISLPLNLDIMSYGRGDPYHGQGNIPTSQGGVSGPEGMEDYYGGIPSHWGPALAVNILTLLN